ncbi:UNVERIFIED_CONTAM: hypothetical protein FKN15_046579 [Acipenser sinensis]
MLSYTRFRREPNNQTVFNLGARNCKQLLQRGHTISGWYTIFTDSCKAVRVLCDMDTNGGGWVVFQRRMDGSVDFYRNWESYKNGFGKQQSEFWLGNENIHMLTQNGNEEFRVDLEDFDGKKTHATYKSFKLAGESELYKLHLGAFLGGPAGDSLTFHNDQPFSTFDKDNDNGSLNCAVTVSGAWWYQACYYSNLNGKYSKEAIKYDVAVVEMSDTFCQPSLFYHLGVRESFSMTNNFIMCCVKKQNDLQALKEQCGSYTFIPYTVSPQGKVFACEAGVQMKGLSDLFQANYNIEPLLTPLVDRLVKLLDDTQIHSCEYFRETIRRDIRTARERYSGTDLSRELVKIQQRLDTVELLSPDIVMNLLLSYRDVQDYDAVIRLVKTLNDLPTCDVTEQDNVKFQYAFALNRRNQPGDRQKALQVILPVVEKGERVASDLYCLCGRIYKDMFLSSGFTDHDSRDKACYWYGKAFEGEPTLHSGINNLVLLMAAGHQFETSIELRKIGAKLSSLLGRKGSLEKMNYYWDVGFYFGASILANDHSKVIQASEKLYKLKAPIWFLGSCMETFLLYKKFAKHPEEKSAKQELFGFWMELLLQACKPTVSTMRCPVLLLEPTKVFQSSYLSVCEEDLDKAVQLWHICPAEEGDNVLINTYNGVLKISDFGTSKRLAGINPRTETFTGTLQYMAPEIIDKGPRGYGKAADIWSLGCTIIEMATGKPPFHELESPQAAMFKVGMFKIHPRVPECMSEEAKAFIVRCFEPDPDQRATAAELLQDPFLRKPARRKTRTTSQPPQSDTVLPGDYHRSMSVPLRVQDTSGSVKCDWTSSLDTRKPIPVLQRSNTNSGTTEKTTKQGLLGSVMEESLYDLSRPSSPEESPGFFMLRKDSERRATLYKILTDHENTVVSNILETQTENTEEAEFTAEHIGMLVSSLREHIHTPDRKNLTNSLVKLRAKLHSDAVPLSHLQEVLFSFQDAVKKILRQQRIRPHWMFALVNLLRQAVQTTITILIPELKMQAQSSFEAEFQEVTAQGECVAEEREGSPPVKDQDVETSGVSTLSSCTLSEFLQDPCPLILQLKELREETGRLLTQLAEKEKEYHDLLRDTVRRREEDIELLTDIPSVSPCHWKTTQGDSESSTLTQWLQRTGADGDTINRGRYAVSTMGSNNEAQKYPNQIAPDCTALDLKTLFTSPLTNGSSASYVAVTRNDMVDETLHWTCLKLRICKTTSWSHTGQRDRLECS